MLIYRESRVMNLPQVLIIIENKKDWTPYYPTDQLILVEDYLFNEKYQEINKVNIINLCQDSSYLSNGYYCSLIAESRGHKCLPSIKTFNDLKNKSIYLNDLDFIKEDKYQKILAKEKETEFKSIGFFGECGNEELNQIFQRIFNIFPAPILEVKFRKNHDYWVIDSVKILPLNKIKSIHQDLFANNMDRFSNKIWRSNHYRKKYIADLAILVDPEEKLPPSNEKSIDRFLKSCKKLNVFCEIITRKDLSRINEFDGLFIRTTTSIDNFTFKFVKKAESEGVVSIDDSISILRCTNKIYMNNKMIKGKIPIIPGVFVSKQNKDQVQHAIEHFGFPLICKIPDGSFSIGVKKVLNEEELRLTLEEMFLHSSLILIQKYLPTPYDWRIGILDNEVLFACKYYMSKGHWQIYNHQKKQSSKDFSGNSATLDPIDVPDKVLKVALKAAKIAGNGLYGVDLKETEKGEVFVVEVNDNPNIDAGVEDKIGGQIIYDKIVRSFIKKIELGRK